MLRVNKQSLEMLADMKAYYPQVDVRITGEKVPFHQFSNEKSVLRMRSAASCYRFCPDVKCAATPEER